MSETNSKVNLDFSSLVSWTWGFLGQPQNFVPFYITQLLIVVIRKSYNANTFVMISDMREALAPITLLLDTYTKISGQFRIILDIMNNLSIGSIPTIILTLLGIIFSLGIYLAISLGGIIFTNIFGRPIYNWFLTAPKGLRRTVYVIAGFLILLGIKPM